MGDGVMVEWMMAYQAFQLCVVLLAVSVGMVVYAVSKLIYVWIMW